MDELSGERQLTVKPSSVLWTPWHAAKKLKDALQRPDNKQLDNSAV